MEHHSEIIFYQTAEGQTKIDVRLEDETVWLNQNQLETLFQTDRTSIVKHIKNIYESGELSETATCAKIAQVQQEGNRNVSRNINYYNLDLIISVGYRVQSHVATQFRIWATQRLREYIVKGFALDDERIKAVGQIRYFDELNERIRDIRSSERIFYLKVKDIFCLSIDYDPKSNQAKIFFATMQNKLHWAIHQHTAAELIAERAIASKQNMGLSTWAGEKVRKSDVGIAKNYLNQDELSQLNLLVEQFLAFAENQARQKKVMFMGDWMKKLNDILTINENDILEHAGKITHELAIQLAEKEYEKYNTDRLNMSDLKVLETLNQEVNQLGINKSKKK